MPWRNLFEDFGPPIMNGNSPTRRPFSRIGPLLGMFALLLAVATGIFFLGRRPAERNDAEPAVSSADPRLTWETPLRNVHPAVRYVGDEACAACHDHGKRYRLHPMGRSAAQPTLPGPGNTYPMAGLPFSRDGVRFEVETRKGTIYHRACRTSSDGRNLYQVEAPVSLAIGSGKRGTSFLVEKNGFLVQSPLSWFGQRGSWDLSPGFDSEQHFDRPIVPQCLFCHVQHAEPVPGTVHRYREPVRFAEAIGCERCHGPGELHVQNPLQAQTIVHPGKLAPDLREDVCHQCHLQGEVRVERRGLEAFAFRPGLPLPLFWAHFLRPKELRENKAVNHVEQLRDSRCFSASKGKMGCVSCHDPHGVPEPDEKAAYFRNRCSTCHADGKGCSTPLADRNRTTPANDCIACHMPRHASADIVHTAVTDHRIPRRPSAPGESPPPLLMPGRLPLEPFAPERRDGPSAQERERDLAIALVSLNLPEGRLREDTARRALPGLNAALERHPDDFPALLAKGRAEIVLGRYSPALATLGKLSQDRPGYESGLWLAANIRVRLGQWREAADTLKRLIEVDPWRAEYLAALAQAEAELGHAAQAIAQARAALQCNPAHGEARKLLVEGLLAGGRIDAAGIEFDLLLELTPERERRDLTAWWTLAKQKALPGTK